MSNKPFRLTHIDGQWAFFASGDAMQRVAWLGPLHEPFPGGEQGQVLLYSNKDLSPIFSGTTLGDFVAQVYQAGGTVYTEVAR